MTQAPISQQIKRLLEFSNYCYSCNACDTVCPLNLVKQFSPRYFLTQIKQQGLRNLDTFVTNNEDLLRCLTCKQCMKECPMAKPDEGMDILEIIRILREYALQNNLMPQKLQESCTHSSVMQINAILQSQTDFLVNKIEFLSSDPSLHIARAGEVAFFMGCHQLLEDKFEIPNHEFSDIARGAIKFLNANGTTPVVRATKCCGHDLYWMGDTENAKNLAEFNVRQYREAGVKTIITECAEGYYMWKYAYPQLVPESDFKVLHLSEYIIQSGMLDKLIMHPLDLRITYHDPCRLGRLSQIYDPPREILSKLAGVTFLEMKHNRASSYCCGAPLFSNCTPEKQILRELRIQEAMDLNVDYIITTCPKCIVHYNCYLKGLQVHPADSDTNAASKATKMPKLIDLSTFLAKYFFML